MHFTMNVINFILQILQVRLFGHSIQEYSSIFFIGGIYKCNKPRTSSIKKQKQHQQYFGGRVDVFVMSPSTKLKNEYMYVKKQYIVKERERYLAIKRGHKI